MLIALQQVGVGRTVLSEERLQPRHLGHIGARPLALTLERLLGGLDLGLHSPHLGRQAVL